MARITVEDCIDKVENRFELVAIASQRAKAISSGAPLLVERDNDKNTVVSLREIANTVVAVESLREDLVQSFQKPRENDDLDVVGSQGLEEMDQNKLAEEVQALMLSETHRPEVNAEDEEMDGVSFSDENVESED